MPIHIVDGSESDHMFRSEILVTIKFCDIKLTPPNSTKKKYDYNVQPKQLLTDHGKGRFHTSDVKQEAVFFLP